MAIGHRHALAAARRPTATACMETTASLQTEPNLVVKNSPDASIADIFPDDLSLPASRF
jgi:hypothetical protein